MSATVTTAASGRALAAHLPRRKVKDRKGMLWSFVAWVCGITVFFPVLWMFLLSFRSESDAATNPPQLLAAFTLDQYESVFARGITPYLINSLMATVLSTVLVILLALPAAYSLAIKPVSRSKDVLSFFLSTKMLPLIAALLPVYLVAQALGALDNIYTLVLLYASMNLPIAIWMLRSFLMEVPREILEAAQMDGAGFFTAFRRIILPMVSPGIAAVSLICFIFAWNEFLFAVNLTATRASTSPIFLVSFITSEGLFLARLSAAATLVSLPVLILGWMAQDKLVSGLAMGAVK